MSSIDDEWASFLTEGAIILSNEKSSAKNIKKSYLDTDKITDNMTSINPITLDGMAANIISKSKNPLENNKKYGVYPANGTEHTITHTEKKSKQLNKRSTKLTTKSSSKHFNIHDNSDNDDDEDEDDDHDIEDKYVINDFKNKDLGNICHESDDEDDASILSIHSGINMDDIQPQQQPKCTDIYISTKTKISYLNMPIDIKKVFWSIPISPYSTPQECIIKKQIKVSTTDPNELAEIKELLKNEKYYQEQEIEHIDNPEGRIKFKVQLKINIGLCKKDILNYRCKLKRAFFNCFVLILRIKDRVSDSFKEMHVKVFNTGKLEIPGIQTDESLTQVLDLLIKTLTPIVGNNIGYIPNKCETVLINSNFNCGYFINRDKLYNILKYKYRINSNYDACSYPGIQCKFYFMSNIDIDKQTGQQPSNGDMTNANEISFMIFRTGSVLIVGRCDENVLHCIYKFLKSLLETEYPDIGNQLNIIEPKKHNVKLRRKIINVTENI
jgi:hypothetical protein